jgi:hypothetical protein
LLARGGCAAVSVNQLIALVWENYGCGVQPAALVRMMSIQQAETPDKDGRSIKGWPEWEALKAQMILIDQLWWYEDHGPLQGSDGYVVVRFGFPVACLPIIRY